MSLISVKKDSLIVPSNTSIVERRHVDLPVYPKPLPERDVSFKIDENGFTCVEKAALRNAWRLIEPFQRRFGKDNFYKYFPFNFRRLLL